MTMYDIIFVDSVLLTFVLFAATRLMGARIHYSKAVGYWNWCMLFYWVFWLSFATTRFMYHVKTAIFTSLGL